MTDRGRPRWNGLDYQRDSLLAAATENKGIPLHLVHGAAVVDQPLAPCLQGGAQIRIGEQWNVPFDLTELIPENEPAGFVDGLEKVVVIAAS
jgi:hypothetical protein